MVAVLGTVLSVLGSRFVKPEYTVTSTIYIETPTDQERPDPGRGAARIGAVGGTAQDQRRARLGGAAAGALRDAGPLAGQRAAQGFRAWHPGSGPGTTRWSATPRRARSASCSTTAASWREPAAATRWARKSASPGCRTRSALQPGQKAEFTVDSHRDASAAAAQEAARGHGRQRQLHAGVDVGR